MTFEEEMISEMMKKINIKNRKRVIFASLQKEEFFKVVKAYFGTFYSVIKLKHSIK